ncbi:MAG: hypothetical protein ACXV2C_06865, partial [Candidatus Bathyarchaeia archaeon]
NISFKSFRHWGGSMIAEKSNGNPLVIMRMLRHKSFKSSLDTFTRSRSKTRTMRLHLQLRLRKFWPLGKAGWQKYDEAVFNGVHMCFTGNLSGSAD